MSKKSISREIKIAPIQKRRRAIELFAVDSPFRAKITPVKKPYKRKPKHQNQPPE
jgi:hypothetical protein